MQSKCDADVSRRAERIHSVLLRAYAARVTISILGYAAGNYIGWKYETAFFLQVSPSGLHRSMCSWFLFALLVMKRRRFRLGWAFPRLYDLSEVVRSP